MVAGAIALALPASASAASIDGMIEGAGDRVKGAKVELYAAAGDTVKLGQAKTTRKGKFTIAYADPAPGDARPLYLIASRGKAHRTRLGRPMRQMVVAGTVSAPEDSVVLSEQTTVAAGFALSRFLKGKQVSGPSPGMPNAAATSANLVEASTGKVSFVLANSPNGGATEALPTFNTLADALTRCTGGFNRPCARLLRAAKPPGKKAPKDTLAAVVDIAKNPALSTEQIFRLGSSTLYQPSLEDPPDAWTLALAYVGGGMNAPGRMGFDSAGRVWTNNNFQAPGTTAGLDLTALSPTGQPILGSPLSGGGLEGAGWGLAIDAIDRVWVSNFVGNSVSLFGPDGQPISPSGGFTGGVGPKPQGLAIDQQGNVWLANYGGNAGPGSVTRFPGGDMSSPQSITGGGIHSPFGIAIDSKGNAWVSDESTSVRRGSVTKLDPSGTPSSDSPIYGGGLHSPQGIAVDSRDNVWAANLGSHSVTRIKQNGKTTQFQPASTHGPWGIAVDGNDNVWVAGFKGVNVTQICGVRQKRCPDGLSTGDPISPSRDGFRSEAFEHLTAVQVDSSGNVWVANNWSTGSPLSEFVGGNGLVELIGAAEPVKTPLIGPPARP